MPNIYNSQISALSGRSNSPLANGNVSADAFGGSVASALGGLAQSTGRAASLINQNREREDALAAAREAATRVATFDTTEQELELRNKADPNGDNYADSVREMYLNNVDEYVAGIENDEVRLDVRAKLMSKLPNVTARAAEYQSGIAATHDKMQTNDALNALQNKISIDPSDFDTHLDEGMAIISALSDTPEILKAGMRTAWEQNSVKRRFEGMLSSANSKDQLDGIYDELTNQSGTGKDWSDKMLPVDFETMLSSIASRKKQIIGQSRSLANSHLSTLENRMTTEPMQLFDEVELTKAQEFVRASEDAALQTRMARVMRDQDIIRRGRALPARDLRREINAVDGNPSQAYPGVPPVVSDAITEASRVYGVSASYLGGTSVREYGQFFGKKPQKFKNPAQFIGSSLRETDIPVDVYNAVNQAGDLLGQSLNVLDKAPGGAADNAVNISTLGMGDEEKAQLAEALVNAGFTGFAEFDNNIQASIQDKVPDAFGRVSDTEFFGGWTNLSPAVAVTLSEMGFANGKPSSEIKRSAKAQSQNDVDFGMPTQIKDAQGKPTSSAVGVMQFTNSTFLSVMRDKTVASNIGVDTSVMSDEDILKLRSDPRVSVIAGAALASKNQKILENTLGRKVNDAELYMAHFLGAARAVSIATAREQNPNVPVSTYLPENVIEANKPVFKEGNRIKTVQEVYDDVSAFFTTSPTQVSYDDNRVRKKMLDSMQKQLKEDPMSYAASVGTHTMSDLTQEGGFSARSKEAIAVADYHSIPLNEMKPFSVDEADYLTEEYSNGNAEQKLQILGQIATMDPELREPAFKQLSEYNNSMAYAGGLYAQGRRDVATSVVRGQQRIQENPSILSQMNKDTLEIQNDFVSATDNALLSVPPKYRQAVQDAALAYYIEDMAKGGGFSWKNSDYKNAVQRVLGGSENFEVLADVNGSTSVIPQGMNANTLENAVFAMDVQDWTAMSHTGSAPMYGDGTVVDPLDINDEVQLRFLGGGRYHVVLDDGSFLMTETQQGLVPYQFVPDVDKLTRISSKAQTGIFGR